ncbi:hypothetical protein O3M35_005315 [Rhynocoris fuscipes]|uniref:Ig-like domain-containing protein n=1 Tax=Rhynocoris fuscipes TaxID=488301 RepID=A0AAW1DLJ7_9HEMI
MCYLFTGSHVRAWKRGIAILTAGNVKLSPDERLSLVHGYDLEIRHIRPEDEGDYVCQIATLQPQEITHTVEVLGKYTLVFIISFYHLKCHTHHIH